MSRPIREKMVRPLRAAFRRKLLQRDLPEADGIRFRRILVRPDLLDRLCSQLETKAFELGVAAEMAAIDVADDEDDRGWRFYLNWLIDNWSTVLQLLAIIIPLLAADREES